MEVKDLVENLRVWAMRASIDIDPYDFFEMTTVEMEKFLHELNGELGEWEWDFEDDDRAILNLYREATSEDKRIAKANEEERRRVREEAERLREQRQRDHEYETWKRLNEKFGKKED